jgi:hypothetical protein
VRCGAVRCDAVRCGVVWCGVVRCGAVRCGAVRCGAVRCGAVESMCACEREFDCAALRVLHSGNTAMLIASYARASTGLASVVVHV